MREAKEIWLWARQRGITLAATHRPGILNEKADRRSREFNDNIEMSIKENALDPIFEVWGKPTVDLFASRLNTKCARFYSWQPDPQAFRINAFKYTWNHSLCYAFPPFNLIGKTLSKARTDNTEMILVTPNWIGQNWAPEAQLLSVHPPIEIMGKIDLLIDPKGNPHDLMGMPGFKLLAWRISGKLGQNVGSPNQQ